MRHMQEMAIDNADIQGGLVFAKKWEAKTIGYNTLPIYLSKARRNMNIKIW